MSGKPKVKIYQYSSEFKYMRSYESQSEVFNKYYDGKKGDLFQNKQYKELPDGTFVSWYKIGREGLRRHTRIDNCPFCTKNITDRSFSAYNLKGEKIATFSSIRVFQHMTNIPINTVYNSLTKGKGFAQKKNLIYKWDDI